MSERVLTRPLSPQAIEAANQGLWQAHPELKGRQLTMEPADARYRKEWFDRYQAALKPSVPGPSASPPVVPKPPASSVQSCPNIVPPSLTPDEINKRLDAASWLTRDDEARAIVSSLSLEQLRNLPSETRQRLRDELSSGWKSDDDQKALNKIWRAEHETAINQALRDQTAMLQTRKADLEQWDNTAKADVKKWFGSDDEATRKKLQERIDHMIDLNKKMTVENFAPADPPKDNRFAYVYPNDKGHSIYLDGAFDKAPATGRDSKAGTLAHEMSHFNDIGSTNDHIYGADNAKKLAQTDPDKAIENADNFEYYMEKVP